MSNLKLLNQTFSPEEKWNKSHQNFSAMLLASWEIWYIIWMLGTLYTSYRLPKMYRQWDSDHC